MILFDGKIYESIEQNRLLDELQEKIPHILQREPLSPEITIDAVDRLREDTLAGRFDDLLTSFPEDVVETYKLQAAALLSKEHLRMKVRTELGNTEEYVTGRIAGFSRIRVNKVPLGVIFHIAAGNMDFLPAYSLAEGLLAGNISTAPNLRTTSTFSTPHRLTSRECGGWRISATRSASGARTWRSKPSEASRPPASSLSSGARSSDSATFQTLTT